MYKASSAGRQAHEGSINPFMPPALALNLFWPVLPAAQYNAKSVDGVGKVATEWLNFVHRRLGEDIRLTRQLVASKSPVEAWSLYADFLQHGVQDYWNEFAAMSKLTSEIMSVGVDSAQGHAQEAPSEASPLPHAA
jgi:hypothetical protein